MTECVIDSSALLASILDEPGATKVNAIMALSLMSAVNFAEVVTILNNDGYDSDQIDIILDEYNINVIAFDEMQAKICGNLRGATKPRGLSLGDRACLALALQKGLPLLTADRALGGVDVGVKVELVR
jgi:ribonuclease VapC